MNAILHGVDFSGGAAPWKPTVKNPTVWVATVDRSLDRPRLIDLRPVQGLSGSRSPFVRLVDLLGAGDFEAAAIDAPFSLPKDYLPNGKHIDLLARVAAMDNGERRPFPTSKSLISLAETVLPLREPKPFRSCERGWGVSTRSTLWYKPRGGAPFAAACLALLARSGRPCWPWSATPGGLLVEAFPAAQLRHWGLPHTGYGRPEGNAEREVILAGLRPRLTIPDAEARLMLASPDALDAVVAAFAAIAVVENRLARRPDASADPEEGWIAVHA